MSNRYIVIDTETTGLSPQAGHRIIEIGGVELIDRRYTHNNFHHYIKPECEIDTEALSVHGITKEFLADKPVFGEILDEFLNYIQDATLIIHNAPFDVGFLNHEFKLTGLKKTVAEYAKVFDTLSFARKKHPGQRNGLDALCKRYNVNNSERELHGALLDAKLLAEVYLAMTGGQTILSFDDEPQTQISLQQESQKNVIKIDSGRKRNLKVIYATAEEEAADKKYFED